MTALTDYVWLFNTALTALVAACAVGLWVHHRRTRTATRLDRWLDRASVRWGRE